MMQISRDRLITFEFDGYPGFIESPNYDMLAKRLKGGIERHSIMAVMVGEVGLISIDDLFTTNPIRLISFIRFLSCQTILEKLNAC
jgi:hypothetical protein